MSVKNKDQNSTFSRLRYLDKQMSNPNLSQKEIKVLKMREQNLLDMLEDGQDTFKAGGKVTAPKTKTQAFADYKKKNGRHHRADPRHPMNSESTGPSTTVKTKRSGGAMKKKAMGYDKGGKVSSAQQAAALKKLMDKAGPNIFKGGSGAGNADMEKMIKKIASVSGKKKCGVVKKKAGGAMKPVPAGKKGLAKLPKPVRNKMGYAKKGGAMKKAAGYKSGGSCRGGGAATRGKGYSKA